MPKERRIHSTSRASPLSHRSSRYQRHSSSSSSSRNRPSSSSRNRPSSSSRNRPESAVAAAKEIKEWEEVRCSVCMEHPHNAVVLRCSSYDKGCRAFMCDTSHRHSNCLDQYRKSFSGSTSAQGNDSKQPPELSCPLCRGSVSGWRVLDAARKFMNAKARNCSLEDCGFTGSYAELRKHARKEHPSVRPAEVDPERQRDWRRMEQQRDLGDLFSTVQSALGGEDDGDDAFDDVTDLGGMFRMAPHFMLFLVWRVSGLPGTTTRSMRFTRSSSTSSSRSRRARAGTLWGESYSELESTGRARADGDAEENADQEGEQEEEAPTSVRISSRPRRQLIMSDDEDDMDGVDGDDVYM